MNLLPKISIIVPVYNVEKYLNKCIDSLLEQEYQKFEVILVDDCSKDRSGIICDKYAQQDERITVIHKEKNEGLGKARKTGVLNARGEWLCYIDSDDWIDKDMLLYLMSIIESSHNNIDIIVFGITMCYEDNKENIKLKTTIIPEKYIARTKEEVGNLVMELDSHRTFPFMWNKIYNAKFVKESAIDFNSIKSMEDFFYNIEIFEKAKNVITTDRAFYNYRRSNRETLVSSYNSDFFELSKKRYLSEVNFLQKMNAFNQINEQILFRIFIKHIISCLSRDSAGNAQLNLIEKKKNAKKYLDDNITEYVFKSFNAMNIKFKIIKYIFVNKHYLMALILGKTNFLIQNKFKSIYHFLRK